MSILAWIVLGLVAGWIASNIVSSHGEGLFIDVVLGIMGAVVGGWLFMAFGAVGATGLDAWSILVSVVGASVFLLTYHAFVPASRPAG